MPFRASSDCREGAATELICSDKGVVLLTEQVLGNKQEQCQERGGFTARNQHF